jgi:hypothetical protein
MPPIEDASARLGKNLDGKLFPILDLGIRRSKIANSAAKAENDLDLNLALSAIS